MYNRLLINALLKENANEVKDTVTMSPWLACLSQAGRPNTTVISTVDAAAALSKSMMIGKLYFLCRPIWVTFSSNSKWVAGFVL